MYSTAPSEEFGVKWKWSDIKWRKYEYGQHKREVIKTLHTEE